LSRRLRPAGFDGPDRDLALLRLLQLFDSQFPVGAFAHSGGVETYAALGGGLPELREILQGQIELGWGRSELGAAHLAWRATDQHGPTPSRTATDQHGSIPSCSGNAAALDSLSRQLDALKVVPAVRSSSLKLGRRARDLLQRLYPEACVDIPPSHHAVVVGAAGRRLGLDARSILVAYAQNLAMGTLASAIRCMSVSPAQAQELLIESHGPLARAVEDALANPHGSLFTCTPALDIRSHQQAFLHTRLFQS
jgi:urease accessory protein